MFGLGRVVVTVGFGVSSAVTRRRRPPGEFRVVRLWRGDLPAVATTSARPTDGSLRSLSLSSLRFCCALAYIFKSFTSVSSSPLLLSSLLLWRLFILVSYQPRVRIFSTFPPSLPACLPACPPTPHVPRLVLVTLPSLCPFRCVVAAHFACVLAETDLILRCLLY